MNKSKPHFRKLVKVYRRPTGKSKFLANMKRHTGEPDVASCLFLSLTLAFPLARWKNRRKHKVEPLKDEDWAREEHFD